MLLCFFSCAGRWCYLQMKGMPPPRHLHVASLAPCAITPTLGDRAHRGALIQGFLGYPALQCQRCLGSGRERRLLHTPTYTGKAT